MPKNITFTIFRKKLIWINNNLANNLKTKFAMNYLKF